MIINLTFAVSADSAPVGFKPCVQAAVDFLSARFQGGAPINLQCGFGGASLGSSTYPLITTITYFQLRSALISKAHTANAVSAAASLPVSVPNGGNLFIQRALAKSLGLLAADSTTDGSFNISSSATLDFSTVNGATPVGFSCFSVASHEITECMGRTLGGDDAPGDWTALGLYSYSALNTRAWLGTAAHSFSINSGSTLLKAYNTGVGSDFGDWSGGGDAGCATVSPNVAAPWSATDDIVMDALGYGFGPPFTTRLTWS